MIQKKWKKKKLASFLLLAMAVALSSCTSSGKTSETETTTQKQGDAPIQVVASFFPMADLCKQIGGTRAQVYTLVEAGVDAHEWEPSPKDIQKIGQADLVVLNGAGMESWADDLKSASKADKKVKWVEATEGMELLKWSDDHDHDGDHHDHDGDHHDHDGDHHDHDGDHHDHDGDHHDHDGDHHDYDGDHHDHDGDHHDHDGDHHHHHHGNTDPHTWLSPKRLIYEVDKITQAFQEVDPEHQDVYQQNAQKYKEQLKILDQKYQELSKYEKKSLITPHKAFGYVCKDYGLKQYPVAGLEPEDEPSPAHLAQLVQIIHEQKLNTVLFDPYASDKLCKSLAQETNTTLLPLSTFESIPQSELEKGLDLLQALQKNWESLQQALKG